MTRSSWLRAATFLVAATAASSLYGSLVQARQLGVEVDFGVFHDRLAPYGRWAAHERFGSVWVPRVATVGWRPYTRGHWVYTDADWMWVSDEPFGWATYHYGRWFLDPRLGWVWVPDTVWSPAWVAWRDSDDYVGWAPLPPDEDIDTDVVFEPVIDPLAFTFVRTRYFADPLLPRYLEPPSRSAFIVRSTVNATRFSIEGSRVIDRGLAVGRIERVIGHPVPRLTIEVSTGAVPTRELRDRVVVYRPLSDPPAVVRQPGRVVIAARPAPARTPPPPVQRAVPARGVPPRATAGGAVPRGEVNGPNAARHQQALQALERQQGQERAELERRHARERQHPPANMSPRALNERQAAETKELLTRQERQLREFDVR